MEEPNTPQSPPITHHKITEFIGHTKQFKLYQSFTGRLLIPAAPIFLHVSCLQVDFYEHLSGEGFLTVMSSHYESDGHAMADS